VAASHGLALPIFQQVADSSAALHLDIHFQGSLDSLRALNDGQCVVAGFPVPALHGAAPTFVKALKPLLKPELHRLIGCVRRRQGLMLRREHAGQVRGFDDLMRLPLRFANRQVGSGTRLLVDHLMHEAGLAEQHLPGDAEHIEETHVAVAASIASGLADVGLGIEAAAAEFGLHFVPLVEEDYFLVCLQPSLQHPAVQRLCAVLAGPEWRARLAALPGYAPVAAPGVALEMADALPWWPGEARAQPRSVTHSQ
jgi:putative molybdopterin biosynthesis protein